MPFGGYQYNICFLCFYHIHKVHCKRTIIPYSVITCPKKNEPEISGPRFRPLKANKNFSKLSVDVHPACNVFTSVFLDHIEVSCCWQFIPFIRLAPPLVGIISLVEHFRTIAVVNLDFVNP